MKSIAGSMPAALLLAFLLVAVGGAEEKTAGFREDFLTLDNWKPLTFPKIRRHSAYTIEMNGAGSRLRAESKASASAIVYRKSFSVYRYPILKWRWKVGNVYRKGDAATKEGDDYPIRIYVMFAYDPDRAGALERIRYGLAKSLYGEYPPHSSLNYVWANKETNAAFFASPYTEKAMIVPLQQGEKKAGAWQEEQVNVIKDYERAFGSRPPDRVRIAVMNDSDNTGESSVSWVEYIEALP